MTRPLTARLLLAVLITLAVSTLVAANNIITADHPPIAPRGWTLQIDDRPTYIRSETFVNRDGSETPRSQTNRQNLLIVRLYLPNMMFRASIPVVSQSQDSKGRYGVGDAFFEGGASLDPGPWRFRLLGFFKAPTGNFDKNQTVNIGGGQWDFGPSIYVTHYFDEKQIDLNLQTQYAFRAPNTDNGIRPGGEWTYNLAAARRIELGVPVRVGLEHRAFFGEPNRRDGAAIAGARRSLALGPVAMIDMGRWMRGFSLWPTMIFDVYDQNMPRNQLYYLKLQLNY